MPRTTGRTTATVASWNDDEGWGVVEAPSVPGGCWVHFSAVRGSGFRSLIPGGTVQLEWETAEQDGHRFRAVAVTT